MKNIFIFAMCCFVSACAAKDTSRKAVIPDGKVIGYWEGTDKPMYEKEWRGKIPHGKWKEFYPDGKLAQTYEYNLGKKTGAWIRWYPNGKLASESHYKDDVRTGVWKTWSEGGVLLSQGSFSEDKEDGLWISWHENGKKAFEGKYKAGLKHGKHLRYAFDGTVEQHVDWQDGQIVN